MDHPNGSLEQIILQALAELGFVNPLVRGQALLLHKRQLVGRRFCFDGVEAVWLSAAGQIKIYDEEGECLRVVDVGEEQRRKAA